MEPRIPIIAMTTSSSIKLKRREDNALYTGITLDVARRFVEHLEGKGAKALRGRSLELVYQVALGEKSLALRGEIRVKALSKQRKERLVEQQPGREQLLTMLSLSQDLGGD